jgi:hypothetical protein
VSRRLSHEAKASEVSWLALDLLIFLWVGGVITGEVEVVEGSIRSGHHLLELLFLFLIPEVVLLVIVLDAIVPLSVVILVGGVKFLSLGAVSDEVSGVATLKSAPRWSPPLLTELVQAWNFLISRTILSSGMLSYCSLEAVDKEDKTNSKTDETVVLVGFASWPPTWVLVIRALLVRDASWLGRPFLNNS